MKMHTLTKSRKTFIRREKARIRRSIMDSSEKEKLISGLYPTANQA
jgi:hypothetical protein